MNAFTDSFTNEVIAPSGLHAPHFFITRGDHCAAMIEAGYDAKTADQFSFNVSAKPSFENEAHPSARAALVALYADGPQAMNAALSA